MFSENFKLYLYLFYSLALLLMISDGIRETDTLIDDYILVISSIIIVIIGLTGIAKDFVESISSIMSPLLIFLSLFFAYNRSKKYIDCDDTTMLTVIIFTVLIGYYLCAIKKLKIDI
tara:strand:+ start:384 stop:734 length:351 start_codon:yes stop_codon:yes gene_type:complete